MTNWWISFFILELSAGLLLVLLFLFKTQRQQKILKTSAEKALKYQLSDQIQPVITETFAELKTYIQQLQRQLEKNFTKEQDHILDELSKLGTLQHKELEKKLESTVKEASDSWQRFLTEQQQLLQNELEETHTHHLAQLEQLFQERSVELTKSYQEQQQQLERLSTQRVDEVNQAADQLLLPLIGKKLTTQLSAQDHHELAMQLLTEFLNTNSLSRNA